MFGWHVHDLERHFKGSSWPIVTSCLKKLFLQGIKAPHTDPACLFLQAGDVAKEHRPLHTLSQFIVGSKVMVSSKVSHALVSKTHNDIRTVLNEHTRHTTIDHCNSHTFQVQGEGVSSWHSDNTDTGITARSGHAVIQDVPCVAQWVIYLHCVQQGVAIIPVKQKQGWLPFTYLLWWGKKFFFPL